MNRGRYAKTQGKIGGKRRRNGPGANRNDAAGTATDFALNKTESPERRVPGYRIQNGRPARTFKWWIPIGILLQLALTLAVIMGENAPPPPPAPMPVYIGGICLHIERSKSRRTD